MKKKSAISLISYDAAYLPESISRYYNYVDEIVLGLDKNRKTWSGNNFSFDEKQLWADLSAIDGDSKISIIEEDFVKSKNMSGYQLWSGQDFSFQEAYQITGIPRFILIDPKGKIVNANAPRPSDPRLKDLFTSLKI